MQDLSCGSTQIRFAASAITNSLRQSTSVLGDRFSIRRGWGFGGEASTQSVTFPERLIEDGTEATRTSIAQRKTLSNSDLDVIYVAITVIFIRRGRSPRVLDLPPNQRSCVCHPEMAAEAFAAHRVYFRSDDGPDPLRLSCSNLEGSLTV
jgi:hypothetical protein